MIRPNSVRLLSGNAKAAMLLRPAASRPASAWFWPATCWCGRGARCTLILAIRLPLRDRNPTAKRAVQKEAVREFVRALHSPPGYDRGPHGLGPPVRLLCIPQIARQRPAGRGLPGDSGPSELSRSYAGNHGEQRGHSARTPVHADSRARDGDFEQRPGTLELRASV